MKKLIIFLACALIISSNIGAMEQTQSSSENFSGDDCYKQALTQVLVYASKLRGSGRGNYNTTGADTLSKKALDNRDFSTITCMYELAKNNQQICLSKDQLHHALYNEMCEGNTENIECLKKLGARINQINGYHILDEILNLPVLSEEHIGAIEMLLVEKTITANVDPSMIGYVPLLCAINAGSVPVVKLLLKHGARTDIKGSLEDLLQYVKDHSRGTTAEKAEILQLLSSQD